MDYNNLNSNKLGSDFMAVKIGDIDGDVKANLDENGTRGSLEDYIVSVDDVDFEKNEWVEVPVYAAQSELLGIQLTLDIADENLTVEDVISGQMELCQECFTMVDGKLTLSWYDVYPLEINDKEPIFTIVFKSQASSSLSKTLSVTSDITQAEAYRNLDEIMNVKLTVTGEPTTDLNYALYQNVPNPFTSSTVIGFSVPSSQNVKLTIFDMGGRVHQVLEGHFDKGYHEFVINSDKMNVEGVLYYQLTAGTFSSTKKMLMLR
jgi:hypothetical protein